MLPKHALCQLSYTPRAQTLVIISQGATEVKRAVIGMVFSRQPGYRMRVRPPAAITQTGVSGGNICGREARAGRVDARMRAHAMFDSGADRSRRAGKRPGSAGMGAESLSDRRLVQPSRILHHHRAI